VGWKRPRAWVGFALFTALAVVGLVVLDGAVAGVTLFVAILVLIGASIYALHGHEPNAGDEEHRTRRAGWFL
jgi:hypothetical protein